MKRQYIFTMFLLCFFVWAVVVDNVIIPKPSELRELNGTFSRYRAKEWTGEIGKVDLLEDELMVYGRIRDREQLFYIKHYPAFKANLDTLTPGDSVKFRYAKRFPKFWKKELYEMHASGYPILRYSSGLLSQKQRDIFKFSGIMTGIFVFLSLLSFINKPRQK